MGEISFAAARSFLLFYQFLSGRALAVADSGIRSRGQQDADAGGVARSGGIGQRGVAC